MKLLRNFLAIVFIAQLSTAQVATKIPHTIKKSGVFKDEYKYSNIIYAANDGADGLLLVRDYEGGGLSFAIGHYFEHYDKNLKLINEYELPFKFSGNEKGGLVIGVISDNENVHLIQSNYLKEERVLVWTAQSVKIKDFKFTERELFRISVDEYKKSFFASAGQTDYDSGTKMILSEDKKSFVVTVDVLDRKKETHKLFWFDNKLNKKLEHTFVRNIKDRKYIVENIEVSKNGHDLYLLGKAYTEEAKKKKKGGEYTFEITKISANGEIIKNLDTETNYANSLKAILLDDKLVCLGFYSEKSDYKSKGICYFELDTESLTVKISKYHPFTSQFLIDKYGKEKDKELKYMNLDRIIINENKEISFNAEERYITTQRVGGYGPGMSMGGVIYIYHYDDIVSVKLSNTGEMLWARNINKRQSGESSSYLSYTVTAKNNNTYFFINSGEKVKELSKDRIQFRQSTINKSNVNIIRVKPNGDFDYQEILDDKDNEVPFMISQGVLLDDSVYFIGRKGREKELLKVTLQ